MGNFLLGFAIGAAIGVAVVIIAAPRSGSDTRHGISETINTTLEVARRAAATREQELWSDFRVRRTREH
jgi:gas vesicle protein